MKIIAFAGSNNTKSINKKLATYAAGLFDKGEAEILDLNDFQMPLFGVDLEAEVGHLPKAENFLAKIGEADILIVSMAENNGNCSVAFKNVFDWASRINVKVFQDKPMLLMATSTGARGGASVLEIAQTMFPRYGGNIKATFSLPNFNSNFDVESGKITNVDFNEALKIQINLFNDL